MSSVLDRSLVGLVLLISAGYAVVSLGPRGLKPRALALLGRCLARAPASLGLRVLARRLAAASTVTVQGTCGGCENCGTEQPATQVPTVAEVNVPVRNIGGRRSGTPS